MQEPLQVMSTLLQRYGICHIYILKKLRKTKKVTENICHIFREDLKKASEKSIGSVKSILGIFSVTLVLFIMHLTKINWRKYMVYIISL